MRDDVMMSLVDKAMTDPEFRQKSLTDLDGTLAEYGFELEPDELEAAKAFQSEVSGSGDVDAALGNVLRKRAGGA